LAENGLLFAEGYLNSLTAELRPSLKLVRVMLIVIIIH